MNFVISFEVYLTPRLSKYVTLLSFKYNAIPELLFICTCQHLSCMPDPLFQVSSEINTFKFTFPL